MFIFQNLCYAQPYEQNFGGRISLEVENFNTMRAILKNVSFVFQKLST